MTAATVDTIRSLVALRSEVNAKILRHLRKDQAKQMDALVWVYELISAKVDALLDNSLRGGPTTNDSAPVAPLPDHQNRLSDVTATTTPERVS